MNILKAFVDLLVTDFNLGTFGQDIFIGGAPQHSPDSCWWLISRSATVSDWSVNSRRKLKGYTIDLYHRDIGGEDFYNDLENIQRDINAIECPVLAGYDVESIESLAFGDDVDLDREDRQVGVLRITINVWE